MRIDDLIAEQEILAADGDVVAIEKLAFLQEYKQNITDSPPAAPADYSAGSIVSSGLVLDSNGKANVFPFDVLNIGVSQNKPVSLAIQNWINLYSPDPFVTPAVPCPHNIIELFDEVYGA